MESNGAAPGPILASRARRGTLGSLGTIGILVNHGTIGRATDAGGSTTDPERRVKTADGRQRGGKSGPDAEQRARTAGGESLTLGTDISGTRGTGTGITAVGTTGTRGT